MLLRNYRQIFAKKSLAILLLCCLTFVVFYNRSRNIYYDELYHGKMVFKELLISSSMAYISESNMPENSSQICPKTEDNLDLLGKLPKDLLQNETIKENDITKSYSDLKPGGEWSPKDCQVMHKVAIIIPYRDRKSHLTRFLAYLIPILKRQRLDFRIIVTEQLGKDLFNKGRLMNAAFDYAETLKVNCVIFHDVDMFPEDDRTPYSCPAQPRHLGAFVDTLKYKLKYKELAGGVLALPMKDYHIVNGYSNLYWGWGGEDDDMGYRVYSLNLTLERPNPEIARFTMLKHTERDRASEKLMYKLLWKAATRVKTDGLNQKVWSVLNVTVYPLYHHLLVDVGPVPSEWLPRNKRSSLSLLLG